MAAVCEFDAVVKGYGNHIVFNHLDLCINEGDMVAITGPSGSGKSTVLNLVGLLDVPDSGQIRLFGETAPRPRTRAAQRYLRHRLGYLFQNSGLIDTATVGDNLAIAIAYSGNRLSRTRRFADALERVGLPGVERRPVHELSGGEQQRVAMARLILKPCEIVLADEPTGSLDPANRDVVVELLHAMNAGGRTIVIATHDDAVVRACSRQIVLDGPRTAAPSVGPAVTTPQRSMR